MDGGRLDWWDDLLLRPAGEEHGEGEEEDAEQGKHAGQAASPACSGKVSSASTLRVTHGLTDASASAAYAGPARTGASHWCGQQQGDGGGHRQERANGTKKKRKRRFMYLDVPRDEVGLSEDDSQGEEEDKVVQDDEPYPADWFAGLRQRQRATSGGTISANVDSREDTLAGAELIDDAKHLQDESGGDGAVGSGDVMKDEHRTSARDASAEADDDADRDHRDDEGGPSDDGESGIGLGRKRRKEDRKRRKRQQRAEEVRVLRPSEREDSRLSKNKRRKLKKKRRLGELKQQQRDGQSRLDHIIQTAEDPLLEHGVQHDVAQHRKSVDADRTVPADSLPDTQVDAQATVDTERELVRSGLLDLLQRMDSRRGLGSKEEDIREFVEALVSLLAKHIRSGGRSFVPAEDTPDVVKFLHTTEIGCSKLFDALRQRKLPKKIVEGLWEIRAYLMKRQYCDANEKYFSLTIGSAAWPTLAPSMEAEIVEMLQTWKRLMTFFEAGAKTTEPQQKRIGVV